MATLPESDPLAREVRRCVEVIRDQRRMDRATSIHAMQTIRKMLANIVGAPEEPKFRKLRRGNKTVASLLGLPGVQDLFMKLGWKIGVDNMEEVWLYTGGEEDLRLLRTTVAMLDTLVQSDQAALERAQQERAQRIAGSSKEHERLVAEIRSDHHERASRFQVDRTFDPSAPASADPAPDAGATTSLPSAVAAAAPGAASVGDSDGAAVDAVLRQRRAHAA